MMDQHTTVLVVDDHEPSRDLFCEALTSAGYVVRAASDGLNAIHHMEETRFDVVDVAPLNGSRSYVRVGPKGGLYATSASYRRTDPRQIA